MINYESVPYSTDSRYKTYIFNEDNIEFSFQYSDIYLVSEQMGSGNPSRNLILFDTSIDEYDNQVNSIRFHIVNVNDGFPKASVAVNEHISSIKWGFQRNYLLKRKAEVQINSLQGWETIITFRERPSLGESPHGPPRSPAFIISRDIFFDYNETVWQISLYSDIDSYNQYAQDDFEHIIQTLVVGS